MSENNNIIGKINKLTFKYKKSYQSKHTPCTSDYTPIASDYKRCHDQLHSKLPYSKEIDKTTYKVG